ncbi:MAG: amidohydrolase family protein [Phycisphaerae bacterium]
MTLPHNRLGLDYHATPPGHFARPRVDIHTHTREVALTRVMVDAARAYGVAKIVTMAPLEDVTALQTAFPGVFEFIAIPNWKAVSNSPAAMADWIERIAAFRQHGAKLIKFHMAPGTRRRWGVSLDDPAIRQVAQHAYDLGYAFMSHVGDPKSWFTNPSKYGDGSYGSFADQFAPLDRFLAAYPDRVHMGAHMGGSLEDLPALAQRLDRYPNYIVDTSATKWIIRAIAEGERNQLREFFLRYQDRILFGSDLVVGEHYDWDHYASRYWTHWQQWETTYRGPSPIADPDARNGDPQLVGLDLPDAVLEKIYLTNAQRWLDITI